MQKTQQSPSDILLDKEKFRREQKVKPELVFWFDAPPRAGAGVFSFVAKEWGNKVHYMCVRPLSKERKAGGWEECDHGEAIVTIIGEKKEPDKFVKAFVQQHKDAIHICNGFRSATAPYFKKYLFPIEGIKIAVWSERPGVYGNRMKRFIKRIGLPVLHRFYALYYGPKVRVLLPLGTLGVDIFAYFGWDRKKLFPFMYDPQISSELSKSSPKPLAEPLRLIYIGRFARSTKGIDVLIDAMEGVIGDNWRLDLVGGYGEFKDVTIAWAEKHPKVNFLGTWPSDEISKRIAQYDVCIVPSRFDGWNVVTNEAIHAGVGVIATDAAVSHDLIEASGAGIVVAADDVNALRKAIQFVIDNPEVADSWKEKAKEYSPRISSESVGNYLIEVLEYTFLDETRPRPVCPWL